MSKYYGEVLGLKLVSSEKGWREFAAGGVNIALHSGPASPGSKGPKIVLRAADVAATRGTLAARGANSARSARGKYFVCATARILTVTRFNCPIADLLDGT